MPLILFAQGRENAPQSKEQFRQQPMYEYDTPSSTPSVYPPIPWLRFAIIGVLQIISLVGLLLLAICYNHEITWIFIGAALIMLGIMSTKVGEVLFSYRTFR